MSRDYPNRSVWLAKRSTPRGVTRERLVWNSAYDGTYVRKRSDPQENKRLTEFANRCNGNRRAHLASKRAPR